MFHITSILLHRASSYPSLLLPHNLLLVGPFLNNWGTNCRHSLLSGGLDFEVDYEIR